VTFYPLTPARLFALLKRDAGVAIAITARGR
jgi:hypothetical protein